MYQGLGGPAAFLARARKNPTVFYTLYARLLPRTVEGPGEQGEHVIKQIVDELHP